MDLIIASKVKMSLSEKIKLLEKRNELEYEIEKTIIHKLEQWSKQKQFELNQKKLEKPVDKLES